MSDDERDFVPPVDEMPRKPRKKAESKDAEDAGEVRGTMTPVQYDDDGWGNVPIQMRG